MDVGTHTSRGTAIVGVADHSGWAVLVTVAHDGTLIDRRRVELIDGGLPKHPHHHEGQALPVPEAVDLVERVRASASTHAAACLDALAAAVPTKIIGITIRMCPQLPPTVAERITNYRAQNVADSVMYRNELAEAATRKGWTVHWYDAKRVLADAARALNRKGIDDLLAKVGKAIGPPWQKDHKIAMAAAIAATGSRR